MLALMAQARQCCYCIEVKRQTSGTVGWSLGLPMNSSASPSGGRDGACVVVPLRWQLADASGSGHLTFRVVDGRLECVGVRVGDPGGASAVEWGTSPQPPLAAALFRALPMGAIIAAGAKLVSEQHALVAEMRAALNDFPAITVEMPNDPAEGSTASPLPVHVIRRGDGPGSGTDKRAESLLVALQAVDLPIESSKHRVGRPPVYGDAHYREIARIYAEAWSNGDRHPTATVAAEYIVVRSTAAKWVSTARKLGFLGPTVPRRAGEIRPASP